MSRYKIALYSEENSEKPQLVETWDFQDEK